MRALLSFTALALVLSLVPASAQMCGGGQQAQASSTQGGGMMCGRSAAADDAKADKPAQKPQAMGMCPCCKNMAMMRGGMMGEDDPHKGMDMPQQ